MLVGGGQANREADQKGHISVRRRGEHKKQFTASSSPMKGQETRKRIDEEVSKRCWTCTTKQTSQRHSIQKSIGVKKEKERNNYKLRVRCDASEIA